MPPTLSVIWVQRGRRFLLSGSRSFSWCCFRGRLWGGLWSFSIAFLLTMICICSSSSLARFVSRCCLYFTMFRWVICWDIWYIWFCLVWYVLVCCFRWVALCCGELTCCCFFRRLSWLVVRSASSCRRECSLSFSLTDCFFASVAAVRDLFLSFFALSFCHDAKSSPLCFVAFLSFSRCIALAVGEMVE